jgi:ornithine cyclodeaminase/alanine dehydrogenase-like protein (mu-crystallin family)
VISKELDIEIQKVASSEEVVRQSEFVVTTTPSRMPYVKTEWLHPDMHITAMGADSKHKQELYPDMLQKSERFLCDSKLQCFRLGELHHVLDVGIISQDADITELGELTDAVPGAITRKRLLSLI